VNSKPVFALEAVHDDLRAAVAHYQSWRPDGEEHILAKYEETISWLAWNPDLFPQKWGRVQRAVLKQSYYVVYFLQETERTLVLAVLDGRRSPIEIQRIVRTRRRVVP